MGTASSEGDAHEHVTNPSEPPPPPPRPPPDGWVFSEQMHMPLQYYSEDTALEVVEIGGRRPPPRSLSPAPTCGWRPRDCYVACSYNCS